MNVDDYGLPDPPKIPEDMLNRCRKSGDFCPVLFEWYKFVGILANFFARLRQESEGVRSFAPLHYASLVGLLNRQSRLMLANVALSHKGLFGETTGIIDRCIFESVVKLSWLCGDTEDGRFERYIAEGLKTELEFESEIKHRISQRDGKIQAIEKRMLESIDRHIVFSGLTREQIGRSKKMPDLASMIQALGQERLMYIVGQRIGSHHVHGTWPSLRMHYLEDGEDGVLRPRDHDCPTHVNQYLFVPLAVLSGMGAFVACIATDQELRAPFEMIIQGAV